MWLANINNSTEKINSIIEKWYAEECGKSVPKLILKDKTVEVSENTTTQTYEENPYARDKIILKGILIFLNNCLTSLTFLHVPKTSNIIS